MDGIDCTREYEDPAELMRRYPISQALMMADLQRCQAEEIEGKKAKRKEAEAKRVVWWGQLVISP